MSAAELVAARESLRDTPAQLAAQLDLTLYELEAFEAGRKKLPSELAVGVRLLVAERRRTEVLAASGLPECAQARELAERVTAEFRAMTDGVADDPLKWGDSEAFDEATARCDEHMRTCALCTAREEYLARHAPPVPELPMSGMMRLVDRVEALGRRAPAFVRPPKGAAGKGRRSGMWIALGLMAVSLLRLVGATIGSLVSGDGIPVLKLLGLAGALLAFGAGMLVAGYLAGWIVDATRPRRHRPTGYVLRGLIITPLLFAAFGGIVVATGDMRPSVFAGITAAMAVVGAVAGGAYWVVDRLRGKLPRPVTR